MWLVLSVLGLGGEGRRVGTLGHQDLGFGSAVCSFRGRNLESRDIFMIHVSISHYRKSLRKLLRDLSLLLDEFWVLLMEEHENGITLDSSAI